MFKEKKTIKIFNHYFFTPSRDEVTLAIRVKFMPKKITILKNIDERTLEETANNTNCREGVVLKRSRSFRTMDVCYHAYVDHYNGGKTNVFLYSITKKTLKELKKKRIIKY